LIHLTTLSAQTGDALLLTSIVQSKISQAYNCAQPRVQHSAHEGYGRSSRLDGSWSHIFGTNFNSEIN